jgi:hypothetical protein
MSEVRNVQITGGAVDHYRKERAGGSTRKKRKEYQDGGDVPPGVPITGAANISAARVIQNSLARGGAASALAAAVAKDESVVIRKTHAPSPAAAPPAAKAEAAKAEAKAEAKPEPKPEEATVKPKLLLHPPKKTPKKIVLAPPAITKPKKRSTNPRDTHKVKVQLSGFKKRVTRAKAITKESSQKPLTDIRKELEEAKLIKPLPKDAKERVPEPVLRSMHRDYLLLRNRAL